MLFLKVCHADPDTEGAAEDKAGAPADVVRPAQFAGDQHDEDNHGEADDEAAGQGRPGPFNFLGCVGHELVLIGGAVGPHDTGVRVIGLANDSAWFGFDVFGRVSVEQVAQRTAIQI